MRRRPDRKSRRTVLKTIAAGAVTLSFAGVAGADDGTRYLVRASDRAAERRIRRRGFSIQGRLADGAVLVVTGEDDASDDLAAIDDVPAAIPDFRFELETPELAEPGDFGLEDDDDGNGNGKENGGRGNRTDDAEEDEEPALFDLQWDKHVTDVRSAHGRATGDGTTIAILDTGVDHTHPDLGNVNTDDSAAVYGGEIRDHTGDWNGHGTHVAGIAAATGEVGVVGTAPDAELVSVRVFTTEDEEQGNFWSDLLLAIEYAADGVGADAANMSIGTIETLDGPVNAGGIRGVTEPVMQYAARQGTVVVGSAGNHGESLQQEGAWTLPNSLAGVLSTSATGPNDELVFYSNWGTNEIDVGAPGGGYETLEKTLAEDGDEVEWPYPTNLVLSTVPEDVYGSLYAYFAGTSMAAPQVTGAAAVVRELAPDATARQVESAIEEGADLVDGRGDEELGAGRLNADNALDSV